MIEGQVICLEPQRAIRTGIVIPNIDITTIQRGGSLTATLLVLIQADNGGELPGSSGGLNEGIVVSEHSDALEEDGFVCL